MQNIEYLVEDIRRENREQLFVEKRTQQAEIIAESKIALIKLRVFADEPLLFGHFLNHLFLIFKIMQWTGVIFTIIWLPILVTKVGLFRINGGSSFLEFGDSYYLTYFLAGVCVLIVGFLGAKFSKIQLHIKSNKRIAHDLVEELDKHIYVAQKNLG